MTERSERQARGAGDDNLRRLVEHHETPLFVYDLSVLRAQCAQFRSAVAHDWFHLYFATMANDRELVLEELARLGVGACVNSIPHLDLALRCGFTSDSIQFSSTGVSVGDMQRLSSLGIRLNVDSISQLRQWASVGSTAAGLRVNATSLCADRPADRIGMDLDDIEAAKAIASELSVSIRGLHVYIGTNLQSHETLVPTVDNLFKLAEQFPDIRYLNIGGGVGVNYSHDAPEFDLAAYGYAVTRLRERLLQRTGIEAIVVLEPGRKLTASCAKMLTRVTDLKTLHGRRYVSVDASVAIFPRPFHHPESPHRIWLLSGERARGPTVNSQVVGRTTFSLDILGESALPEDLQVGDVLVFDDAGAYSQSMASRFLGQPAPSIASMNERAKGAPT